MSVDHRPCLTDEEVAVRVVQDRLAIEKLEREGHQVRAVMSYHSEVTMETHALPIFSSDTLEDVVNRFYDFFPKDFDLAVKETEQMRQTLHRGDAMSQSKTVMAMCRIPLGLYKLLDAWLPGFWDIDNTKRQFVHRKLVRRLLSYCSRLRMTPPYGKPAVRLS
jgi:hypothetical protein